MLAQARREAEPGDLALQLSLETPLINSLGAIVPASRGPGSDHALLAMIDQELEAFRLRVDESLRPIGFSLRDLALQLVAAEALRNDGTVRKAQDNRLEKPTPGTEELFPPPPWWSLAAPISPEELTPPSRRPLDLLTGPQFTIDPPPLPTPSADTLFVQAEHAARVEASLPSRRPEPIPPTGRLADVYSANPAVPPGPGRILAPLPADDTPALAAARDEVRFTGLRGDFEADTQRATPEAGKAKTLRSRRMFRNATGLAPFFLFATAAAAYFFADSLGVGVARDKLRLVVVRHIDAAGKTFEDAYHAADQEVADLLEITTAWDVEIRSTDRGPKPDEQATTDADSRSRPTATPSSMVAPELNKSAKSVGTRPKSEPLSTQPLKTVRKIVKIERIAPILPPQRATINEQSVVPGLPLVPSVDRPAEQMVVGIVELRRRARVGDARAQHELAGRFIQGHGVEKNFREGADWFREAAIQGVANAQYNLGVLYERGLGVTKDDVRALLWYQNAAEQSHPLAQYNLGNFYLLGRGIPLSYTEAGRWFKAASDQGIAKATYNLGVLIEDGLGVPPDLPKALSLYEKAAASGLQKAASRLAVLRDPGAKELKPATFANTAGTQTRGPTTVSTVAGIQVILQRQGMYFGRLDGIVSPGTGTAIRVYQQLHAMPINGIPSKLLLDYMKNVESTGAKPVGG